MLIFVDVASYDLNLDAISLFPSLQHQHPILILVEDNTVQSLTATTNVEFQIDEVCVGEEECYNRVKEFRILFYRFRSRHGRTISQTNSVFNIDDGANNCNGRRRSLTIYPNGNKNAGGQDHVSIYLVLRDQSSLPAGSEVNAIVNLYVYNFLEDEFITTQEMHADSSVRRFNVLKSDWGVSKFIDHATLNDPSKGYLIDDTCVFGVDVFVLNTKIKGECITMIEEPRVVSYSWKFDNFSNADLKCYNSTICISTFVYFFS
ncbi:hypothetical protein TanjilG_06284 [Lupinus angustifolius]|uniref:MATH domain-containing protein n=1 Tax=Lupinus angustifolius TaxID=3871 RepID=A0A1J7G4Y9_LUPAN|nr:hypothetical protein TanjilG_06284 [Lupinus angustifolius]